VPSSARRLHAERLPAATANYLDDVINAARSAKEVRSDALPSVGSCGSTVARNDAAEFIQNIDVGIHPLGLTETAGGSTPGQRCTCRHIATRRDASSHVAIARD
jgi:hypothetical protein